MCSCIYCQCWYCQPIIRPLVIVPPAPRIDSWSKFVKSVQKNNGSVKPFKL